MKAHGIQYCCISHMLVQNVTILSFYHNYFVSTQPLPKVSQFISQFISPYSIMFHWMNSLWQLLLISLIILKMSVVPHRCWVSTRWSVSPFKKVGDICHHTGSQMTPNIILLLGNLSIKLSSSLTSLLITFFFFNMCFNCTRIAREKLVLVVKNHWHTCTGAFT